MAGETIRKPPIGFGLPGIETPTPCDLPPPVVVEEKAGFTIKDRRRTEESALISTYESAHLTE